jgi:predicted transcriptional regulator
MAVIRRTTILADADLLERVDRLARRQRTTKTAIVVAALEAYLEGNDARPRLAFVGVGRSEHGRLSLDGRTIARRELGRKESGSGSGASGTPPRPGR